MNSQERANYFINHASMTQVFNRLGQSRSFLFWRSLSSHLAIVYVALENGRIAIFPVTPSSPLVSFPNYLFLVAALSLLDMNSHHTPRAHTVSLSVAYHATRAVPACLHTACRNPPSLSPQAWLLSAGQSDGRPGPRNQEALPMSDLCALGPVCFLSQAHAGAG